MQEQTFNISAADMAIVLMTITAIEDILSSGGTVSDDVLEELEYVQPALERMVFEHI